MKQKFIYLIATALCLLLSACSSHEEPNDPYSKYKGPWLVSFEEDFKGTHNNSDAFLSWYNKYYDRLTFRGGAFRVKFSTGYEIKMISSPERLMDYYSFSAEGHIAWEMILQTATIQELEAMRDEFESLTIGKINREYDVFTLNYMPLDGDWSSPNLPPLTSSSSVIPLDE